ncbi:MAG: hypothetical protein HUU54_11885 [Ignavibacteriaceae bacterium]|nr:hypothetical protein [Ignavibacteriaceae bacterium]
MNPILKGILAVVAGVIVGSAVNMAIVMAGPSVIPPPGGADVTTMEGLKASLHLFEPKHFIMPFLAHALGALSGAFLAALIAPSRKLWYALGIGLWNLVGGVMNTYLLPSPLWFTILDLTVAYLPMGYLGWKLADRFSSPEKVSA